MKKLIWILAIVLISLLAFAVLVESSDFSSGFEDFIINIAEQQGINASNITNITQVDFNNLPPEINLPNIDETSLGLFQIDLGTGTPVYVLTMSDSVYTQTQNAVADIDLKRSYFNFGYAGKMPDSGFLQTATGVESSLEKGYVMMRSGSITGISTNLEITKNENNTQLDVIIYKNGISVGLGNTLISSTNGVKTDYDIQSEGILTFEAGDVLSVYINSTANIDWADVTTSIEITTSD